MNITKFFELAKNASKMSDYNKKNIHIGSVLVYKNKVISTGWNTSKTNPIQMKYNRYRELCTNSDRNYKADSHLPCLHSEMKCILDSKDIDIDWSKASIFIYREDGKGNLRNCYPCISCMKALEDRGIKDIYYTNESGYNYERRD